MKKCGRSANPYARGRIPGTTCRPSNDILLHAQGQVGVQQVLLNETHRPVFHRDLVDGTVEVRAGSQRERRQVISPERAIVPIGRAECMARGPTRRAKTGRPGAPTSTSPQPPVGGRGCAAIPKPQHAAHATHPIRILMSISLFIIRLQLIISNLRAKNANICIPDAYPIHPRKRVVRICTFYVRKCTSAHIFA